MGSESFRWSYADNFGVLARGANCTNVHLARLMAGVQKAGLDVHDISLASGSAGVIGYDVSPVNAHCSGTGMRISRIRSVARRRRFCGRAMELGSGQEFFLALSNRGALSILDASYKFARASDVVSGEPWSTVRLEQRTFGQILCPLRSDWVFAGLVSASVRMHRQTASGSRFVKDVVSQLRRWDKVPEQFQVHRCQITCASLRLPGSRFGMFKFGRKAANLCDTALSFAS